MSEKVKLEIASQSFTNWDRQDYNSLGMRYYAMKFFRDRATKQLQPIYYRQGSTELHISKPSFFFSHSRLIKALEADGFEFYFPPPDDQHIDRVETIDRVED